MQIAKLSDYKRGWFVGEAFDPTLHSIDTEVAIQRYSTGMSHQRHKHSISSEINVIVQGEVIFQFYNANLKETDIIIAEKDDIVIIEPEEITKFRCVKDAILVVVKTHSIIGDKFLI